MAHPRRADFVAELERELPDAEVAWDRIEEIWDTARRALLAYDPWATHHLVVQDDAILCRDLLPAVERAIRETGEHPVSLYLGHGIRRTAWGPRALATVEGRWLRTVGPNYGVAVVVPTEHIPDLVRWCDQERHFEALRTKVQRGAYDMRLTRYYRRRKLDCWYTMPSLVDHRGVEESPSMMPNRMADRHALDFIGADRSALEVFP